MNSQNQEAKEINSYKIRQPFTDQCLTLDSDTQGGNYGRVDVLPCIDSEDQQWILLKDTHQIVHKHTDLCLSASGKLLNAEGTSVVVVNCEDSKFQFWDYKQFHLQK